MNPDRQARHRKSRRRSRYAVGKYEVFYDGRPVKGASASTFEVLGDGYARDNWCVYYAGMMVKDAHPGSFKVLRDGYGKDAWNTFLRGRKIGR